jgi:hypothetical protein
MLFPLRTARIWFVMLTAATLFLLPGPLARADVVINVLAVNGKESPQERDIEASLPGEIVPGDVLDDAGLKVEYNVIDAGYYVHGKVPLQPKESKTFRVRVKDVWWVTPEQAENTRRLIEEGFKEMGAERGPDNGAAHRQKLLEKLNYILKEQDELSGSVDQRIDNYRNYVLTLRDIRSKASLIDFWRSDAAEDESKRVINYVIEVANSSDKPRKLKQHHYLPEEVRPEYILDRQGYEVRFDDRKNKPFLFKEEDLGPKEKKNIRINLKDVWFVQPKSMLYIRERSIGIYDTLETTKYASTAKTLFSEITNNLDLIDMLQATRQEDITQHIGVYRINLKRFDQAKEDLDALEKLLSRHRAELEKSRIKNVMQKIRAMKSLARVSEAMFDKKPTVNSAWKIIGSVMIFLGFFTIIHFVVWFMRSSKEKKQEAVKLKEQQKQEI